MRTYTIGEHLAKFQPLRNPELAAEMARWAIDQAKLGQWQSTREWDGDLVTVAHVIEHLQLGVFLPTTDAWAPLD